jgi:hypothetical protein
MDAVSSAAGESRPVQQRQTSRTAYYSSLVPFCGYESRYFGTSKVRCLANWQLADMLRFNLSHTLGTHFEALPTRIFTTLGSVGREPVPAVPDEHPCQC